MFQWGYGQQQQQGTDPNQSAQAYNAAAWGAYNTGTWPNWGQQYNQQYQQWYGQQAAGQYAQSSATTSTTTTGTTGGTSTTGTS